MEKLKSKSSGIKHNQKLYHADFRAMKGVFNLHKFQTESMDSF